MVICNSGDGVTPLMIGLTSPEETSDDEKGGREPAKPNLFDLPWEDVLHRCVLPHLSWEEIFRLRRVCRGGYHLVHGYVRKCRVVDIASISHRITELAFCTIVQENNVLTTLILRNCKWLTDKLLKPVLENNRGLVVVDLSGCTALTSSVVELLATQNTSVKMLLLRDCYWLNPGSLKIISCNCSSLERVDLTSCWEVNDASVMQLVENCPKLKYLCLARIYGITDLTLRAIAQYCPHLEQLNLSSCWRVTDQGMRFIAEYCARLQCLEVHDCRDVTEVTLAKLRLRVKIDRPCFPPSYYSATTYLHELGLHIQA